MESIGTLMIEYQALVTIWVRFSSGQRNLISIYHNTPLFTKENQLLKAGVSEEILKWHSHRLSLSAEL